MASCCVYVHMYAHLYMFMWWPSGNAEISISLGLLSEKCYCCFCECIGVAHGQIQVIFNCASENIFFFLVIVQRLEKSAQQMAEAMSLSGVGMLSSKCYCCYLKTSGYLCIFILEILISPFYKVLFFCDFQCSPYK